MKRNQLNTLRNIGIIAHVDAGKTTVSEKILYFTGRIHKTIEVHEGGATMDTKKTERDHGITVSAAATSVSWREHLINIVDTPGHIDFNIEVRCALRVLDGAVVVFDAVAGVEPQTETNWRLADDYGVARIGFVNKLDRAGADFDRVCRMMRERLGVEPLPLQMPVYRDDVFTGVIIDLIGQRALRWADPEGREIVAEAIPPDLLEEAGKQRHALIEKIVDHDDEAAEVFLAGGEVSRETAVRAIRAGVLRSAFVPVLCGSALKNRGIQPVLDAIVDYLPCPADLPVPDHGGDADDLAALVFKTDTGQEFGTLSFCRVYGGELKPGEMVWNPRAQKRERVSRIFRMHADQKEAIDSAQAGDIVALSGLKLARTGDTLSAVGRPEIVLERITVPEPVATVVLEAADREQREKLAAGLDRLLREDPTLHLATHPETGQLLLSGMGELQLQIACEELDNRHGIAVQIGAPQVSYRETLTSAAKVTYRHKKQGGGPGQFAEVTLRLEPLRRGEGFAFESRIRGGSIDAEYIPAVERGIRDVAQSGVLAGYPVIDFKAILLDGATHSDDSSALAFQIAGSKAFKEAFAKAEPVVLEPVMKVEVTTPGDYLGDVIGDLSRRRGVVTGTRDSESATTIDAEVPLAEMFGYIGNLRSATAGRGSYSMEFGRFAEVPARIRAALIAA